MKREIYLLFLLLSQASFGQHIYHVAVSGDDDNPGTKTRPLRSINAAAQKAMPGDEVIVHAGIYREWVKPVRSGTAARRITFMAAPGEKVTIKGSEIVKGWLRKDAQTWQLNLSDSFFGDFNPYKDQLSGDWYFPDKIKLHSGQVYLNGAPYREALTLDSAGSWQCHAADGMTIITANFGNHDPNKEVTEINVRQACFYPAKTGINYIIVKGFRMEQAATPWAPPTAEQVGLIGTNWSKGWIIENNVISDSRCAGITLGKDRASGQNVWSADMSQDGSEVYNQVIDKVIKSGWSRATIGSHMVRHNTIFRCGQAGICGSLGAIFSRIEDNDIYAIYTDRSFYGAEMAGIKLHGAIDVVIRDNRIHNAFIGIWLDWMAQGTRVSYNTLSDNDYVDFFPEVDHGPNLVDHNCFLSTHSIKDWSEKGTYIHNIIGGTISWQPQRRITPWFEPHSTLLAGKDIIKGGSDSFYYNVFFHGRTIIAPPKMHPWDSPDVNIGWGINCFKNTAITVSGNSYIYDRRLMSLTSKHVKTPRLGKAR